MSTARTFRDRAADCWGDALPEWVLVMAVRADASSQNRVAKELGISAAQVSQIISRSYAGRLETAETRVRGLFMNETIACPALGTLSKATCHDWRKKALDFSSHNSLRVRMFRACRGCKYNKAREDTE